MDVVGKWKPQDWPTILRAAAAGRQKGRRSGPYVRRCGVVVVAVAALPFGRKGLGTMIFRFSLLRGVYQIDSV